MNCTVAAGTDVEVNLTAIPNLVACFLLFGHSYVLLPFQMFFFFTCTYIHV